MVNGSFARRIPRRAAGASGERGVGLVESLIAVAILGVALVAFLAAFSTGSMAVGAADRHVTAENLARTQMENVMGQAYAASYVTITEPAGYSITITVSSVDGRDQNEIQKITVEVTYDGGTETLETYKVNR
jgi:type II secretory pathway pseudopilin PulG